VGYRVEVVRILVMLKYLVNTFSTHFSVGNLLKYPPSLAAPLRSLWPVASPLNDGADPRREAGRTGANHDSRNLLRMARTRSGKAHHGKHKDKAHQDAEQGATPRAAKGQPESVSARPPKSDPYAEREAQKYDNPLPSREFIIMHLEAAGEPLTRQQIAEQIGIFGEEAEEGLRRRLRAMERDGQLIFTRRGGYALVSKMDMVRGRVIGHPDGFGFLSPEDGSADLFLSGREMHSVLHGDRVVARVSGMDRRGRREGAIVEVLERANRFVVGRYVHDSGIGYVLPDNMRINQDILVPSEQTHGAEVGQFVVVELVEQPNRYRQPIGRVVEIIGEHMAPGMEIDIAIRAHSLPMEWPLLVEAECSDFGHHVPDEAKADRLDLRQMQLVTIDGEDTKDFDDAVYAEPSGDGWRLVVAIADVSHYVRPGTALDAEARNRGNSVYFPGRVIPMLPEILSNGLCSINPEVDRLCMVCDMRIDASGDIEEYRFHRAVMRSAARLTYGQVAKVLQERDAETRETLAPLVPMLEHLYDLFHALQKRRARRGAIDFDTTETRIVFGENKKIENVVEVTRNDAHRLIEECMLAANVATAMYLESGKIPTLYRVHPRPKEEKLANLREFLAELGLELAGGEKPLARNYSALLKKIKERPDFHLIQTVMLRSLSQATYTPENEGHFGLAYKAYAHFTSPIRRYPDLLVHRAINHLLDGKSPESFYCGTPEMVELGEHCSMTERRADDATRDAVDWLKCEFMLDHVGDRFEGTISSVTGFGLFIELDQIYVEGMVHVSSLHNDYYHFDPVKHRLLGERTSRMYRIGDRVEVKVVRVDLDERKIEFELYEEPLVVEAPSSDEHEQKKRKKRRRNKHRNKHKD